MNIYGNLNVSSGPRMTQYEGLLVSAINFPNTTSPTNEKENITTFMLLAGIPLIIQWDILMKLTEILADW